MMDKKANLVKEEQQAHQVIKVNKVYKDLGDQKVNVVMMGRVWT